MTGIFGAIAEGPAHIPAHMSAIKFPGRAMFFRRTKLFFPAWLQGSPFPTLIDKQKIEQFFRMTGNCTPALLVAVNGFERNAKKFSELFLGFAKFFSEDAEIVFVHAGASWLLSV